MEQIAENKKYDLDRVVRLVLTVVGVVAAVLVVDYLTPVLFPFLMGFILAYVLEPAVDFVQRLTHIKNRMVLVVLTLLLVFGVLVLVGWLVIPYVIEEIAGMTKMLAAYAKASFHIPYIPAVVHDYVRQYLDVEQIASMLSKEQWMKVVNQVATGTWSFVGGTMSVILNVVSWLIVLLYMFFVLLDYDKLSRTFKGAIPKRYRKMAFKVIDDVEETMSRYFRGQALVSLFVGIIFAIEFYIIGLPMAIVFGLFIGCVVASVATGGSFWVLFGWTFAAYCICQVIQDLVLIPAIMKEQMGLNPAIIFLALSLWGYILGFVGLIIALPLTTLIISYYCEFVLNEPNPLYKNSAYRNRLKKKHRRLERKARRQKPATDAAQGNE